MSYAFGNAGQESMAIKGNAATCTGTACYANGLNYAVRGVLQSGLFGKLTQTCTFNSRRDTPPAQR